MSNPSNQIFECRWQASGLLLTLYVAILLLAAAVLLVLPVPLWLQVLGLLICLLHAVWAIPSHITLSRSSSWLGLRHDQLGWSLWNRRDGWQSIQLRPDSLALPSAVILRFKLPGDRFARGLCIPRGAMSADLHRRLRLRLKFSRRRWAAPG
ncbi:hypothetical protein MCB86_10305 [Pseudomonas sp. KSR10]|uniref:Toxin CptA n=1 Tax=Stutzerimonas stutzeri TaxID=316 RepID=A0A0D9AVV2_STUST|nr:protein YgfX [Stutzerimonas stutzeri]KJH83506.1 hypothetical protein UF78_05455 [Stutzerimonas stutzeri]MCG6540463.1 hypothetical protein [Pseudomonas sp. KSR10]